MIPATPVGWFARLFTRHARTRLYGRFGRIWVSGLGRLVAALSKGPIVVVSNHTAWWDPLVAIWLARGMARADAYALMDAANLERLSFFGKVGAFGANLADRRDGARVIRYAAGLLDRPGRLVWIYPEGRERSPFEPLELRPGASAIARLSHAHVVAIGTRFLFGSCEKPELWISVSPSLDATADLKTALAGELGRIDAALATRAAADFELLHEQGPSILARFAERALAFFARRI